MSLLPYVIDDLLRGYAYDPLTRLYDQNYGLGLTNDDLLLRRPLFSTVPLTSGYLRLVRPNDQNESGVSAITNAKNEFKVNLDVQQFKPEEINVKVVDDYLVIDAKHEEKQDKHGYISRQFTRRYKLPPNVEFDKIQSNISSDGILSVLAPKKVEAIEGTNERQIPIVQTNQPSIKVSKEGNQEKQENMES